MAEETHTQRRRMIRSDESKLIYLIDDNMICRYCDVQHAPLVELYDLSSDPAERSNVAERNPDLVEDLRSQAEQKATAFERQQPSISSGAQSMEYEEEEELYSRLEELGYR